MLSNRIVASMLLLGYCVANVIPTDFFLDTEGMSIAPGHDHICVLERQPGIDIGGRPRCWGRNDYKKCDAPPDVSDWKS